MIFITEKQKGRQAFGLEDSVKIYLIKLYIINIILYSRELITYSRKLIYYTRELINYTREWITYSRELYIVSCLSTFVWLVSRISPARNISSTTVYTL